MIKIKLEINNKTHELEVRDSELLIETLRDRLGLLAQNTAVWKAIAASAR